MRISMVLGLLAAIGAAGAVHAAPTLRIRGAAARVVVIPEARSDISVSILKANPRLPLHVSRFGETITVQGDIGHRMHDCQTVLGRRAVLVWGRGRITYEDMPQLVVHTPLDVRISAGDAVFGAVGRSDSLDLANKGCGDWTIANVKGHMRLSEAGSGDARAGAADSADIMVAGSSDVALREIRAGLVAVSTGSGGITATSVGGPFNVRIAGSGDVKAGGGQVTDLKADVAGSGDVRFGGVAKSLTASVAGSGDVTVAVVTGPVSKRVFGPGEVTVEHDAIAGR
jgi:hypothetical protein